MITRREFVYGAGAAVASASLPVPAAADPVESQVALYVDRMIEGGYNLLVIEDCFPDGSAGICTVFPDRPRGYDPMSDESLPSFTDRDSRKVLASELRRRGMILRAGSRLSA